MSWLKFGKLSWEPTREIMALFILCKLILQTHMCSHPVGLDVWFLVGLFIYFHTSCVWTAKALVRLCGCAGSPEPLLVAYVISTIISWAGSNYHNMGSHLMFLSGNKIQHWWITEENGWLHVHQEFVTETLQHSKQGGIVNQYTLLTPYFQILHEWSFHMKWAFGEFRKFRMKWPQMWCDCLKWDFIIFKLKLFNKQRPMGHNGSPEWTVEKSSIQHFSLSLAMATNQNEKFAQNFYARWRTTLQTFMTKFCQNPQSLQ